jgi:exodeoxyribonuclease VII small subunit
MDESKMKNEAPIAFEDALARLEEIVHSLEEGNIGLSESLERYEEGVKLLRQSYEILQRAERKIEILSGVDAEGRPIVEPFDDTATIDQESAAKGRSRRRSSPAKPAQGDDSPDLFGDGDGCR